MPLIGYYDPYADQGINQGNGNNNNNNNNNQPTYPEENVYPGPGDQGGGEQGGGKTINWPSFVYPGPGSDQYPGPKLPEYPGKNPWESPLNPSGGSPYGLATGNVPPGQENLVYGQGGTGQQAQNALGNATFDPSKNIKGTINGLDAFINKPPKTYDEAGGYDQFIQKWNEFYQNLRKMLGLGDTWSQDDIDKLRPFFEQMGVKFQAKPGEKWSSRIYIPDGRGGYIQIDTRGGQGQSGWVNYGHTEQSGAFSGGAGTQTGSGNPPKTSGSGTGTSGQNFMDWLKGQGIGTEGFDRWGGRADDFYTLLLDRINQSLKVDRMDPIIRNQSDAFSAMQTRALRNYLNETAERTGAFANIGAERRSGAEKVGQATSQFEAQLMGQELSARREEIAQAISQMGNLIPEEQRVYLQQYLGLIDAALRKLGLDQDMDQFLRRLGFDTEDRATYYDLIRRGLL